MEYIIIRISRNIHKNIRNRMYKTLLGTTVTIKDKKYRVKGLIKKVNGKALSPGLYMIPSERLEDFIEKLREKGLDNYIEVLKLCLCACTLQH